MDRLFELTNNDAADEPSRPAFDWQRPGNAELPRAGSGNGLPTPQDALPNPVQFGGTGLNIPDGLKRPWLQGQPRPFSPDLPKPTFPGQGSWPNQHSLSPSPAQRQFEPIAPTLRIGEAPAEGDRTRYNPNDQALKVYQQTKDSIVKITVRDVVNGVEQTGTGSGFFVTEDGKLATAYHVVDKGGDITIETANGRQFKAKVVDVKPMSDLAVLQVESAGNERFKPLELADTSRGVPNGTDVYVVGHPKGWSPAYISGGTIASRHPISEETELEHPNANPNHMIITADMNVQKGNSGSPLLNSEGKVIGVLSFGDAAYTSSSEVVEDLNSLLGRARTSDYFPNSLTWTPTVSRDLFISGLGTTPSLISKFFPKSRVPGFVGVGAGWFGASTAFNELTDHDLDAFIKSWGSHGTTAERFSTTTNLGADLSMIAGGAAMLIGGARYRTAASIALSGGSLWKALNGLGADRAY